MRERPADHPARATWPTLFVALAILYIGGYGIARWRKVLVRHEYFTEGKASVLESTIISGTDLRSSGIGAIKNAIAPQLAVLYSPLRMIEAVWWNLGT